MNLYELATREHNKRVQDRRRMGVGAEDNMSFEMQDAMWSIKRAAEKTSGRRRRLGSWRQRRGNGSIVVVEAPTKKTFINLLVN